MAWGMQFEVGAAQPSARRALRRRRRRRDRAAGRRRRPRRAARRARPRRAPSSPPGWRPCPASGPRSATSRCRSGSAAGTPSPTAGAARALTPYVLSAGRAPAGPGEVVTGYPAALGARLRSRPPKPRAGSRWSASPGPRHPVSQQTAIFLTDAEAARLAGHPGRVDAIGVLAGAGLRRRAPARRRRRRGGAHRRRARPGRVSRAPAGADHVDRRHRGVRRARAVHRDVRRGQHDGPVDPAARARDRAPASGGRDARSDPPHDRVGGGDRRPHRLGGRHLARRACSARSSRQALVRHGIVAAELHRRAPAGCRSPRPSPAESRWRCSPSWPPGGAPPACRRRIALTDAAVEPRLLGPGRLIGGLLALAGAVPLFAVSTTTRVPETAAATSEMTAIMLVLAVGFLGPIVARLAARLLGPAARGARAGRRLPRVREPAAPPRGASRRPARRWCSPSP